MIDLAEYRTIYENAISLDVGSGFWARNRRVNLEESWNYMQYGKHATRSTESYLAVNIGRPGEAPTLPAIQAFTKALQDATARLSWARRRHKSRIERLSPQAIRDSQLTVPLMIDGTMYLDLKRPEYVADSIEDITIGNWAELGLLELCQTLPESSEDDYSVNAILSANEVVRRAMSDITRKATIPDLEFFLQPSNGKSVTAVLTRSQSRKIRSALSGTHVDQGIETINGTLDGLRTKRRRFYLNLPSGRECEGSVEPELVEKLPKYVSRDVVATVKVTTIVTESGSRSKERYNLVGIRRARRARKPYNVDMRTQETLFTDPDV